MSTSKDWFAQQMHAAQQGKTRTPSQKNRQSQKKGAPKARPRYTKATVATPYLPAKATAKATAKPVSATASTSSTPTAATTTAPATTRATTAVVAQPVGTPVAKTASPVKSSPKVSPPPEDTSRDAELALKLRGGMDYPNPASGPCNLKDYVTNKLNINAFQIECLYMNLNSWNINEGRWTDLDIPQNDAIVEALKNRGTRSPDGQPDPNFTTDKAGAQVKLFQHESILLFIQYGDGWGAHWWCVKPVKEIKKSYDKTDALKLPVKNLPANSYQIIAVPGDGRCSLHVIGAATTPGKGWKVTNRDDEQYKTHLADMIAFYKSKPGDWNDRIEKLEADPSTNPDEAEAQSFQHILQVYNTAKNIMKWANTTDEDDESFGFPFIMKNLKYYTIIFGDDKEVSLGAISSLSDIAMRTIRDHMPDWKSTKPIDPCPENIVPQIKVNTLLPDYKQQIATTRQTTLYNEVSVKSLDDALFREIVYSFSQVDEVKMWSENISDDPDETWILALEGDKGEIGDFPGAIKRIKATTDDEREQEAKNIYYEEVVLSMLKKWWHPTIAANYIFELMFGALERIIHWRTEIATWEKELDTTIKKKFYNIINNLYTYIEGWLFANRENTIFDMKDPDKPKLVGKYVYPESLFQTARGAFCDAAGINASVEQAKNLIRLFREWNTEWKFALDKMTDDEVYIPLMTRINERTDAALKHHLADDNMDENARTNLIEFIKITEKADLEPPSGSLLFSNYDEMEDFSVENALKDIIGNQTLVEIIQNYYNKLKLNELKKK